MLTLRDIVRERVLLLDGAMGTMIQRYGFGEADFRGELFLSHSQRLAGNNDILVLTQPEAVAAIHRQYLEAGADIIETCTFNSQRISQSEYKTEDYVRQINREAVRLARREAERMTRLTPDRPRFVAGAVGPMSKMASMSPDPNDAALRAVNFDTLYDAYIEQIDTLVESGVDAILVETVFDTLNAKAALVAARDVMERRGVDLPLMVSITVADAAGRMLAGQSLEAAWISLSHFNLFSIGLNCSFGAKQMVPHLKELSRVAACYVSAYPNAGLPNAMGEYDQTPQMMADDIRRFVEEGIVNIVGGCCGSTPEHIRAIDSMLSQCGRSPRILHNGSVGWLSGLDSFSNNGGFINVGERCNVAGSRKFLRLIGEKNYAEALSIARRQVEDGAMVLDINMDDAMLSSADEMRTFLNYIAADVDIARVPIMVDSSRFDVIETALKCLQGKCIVNSLSLKEGEELFVERARIVRRYGAALVVMAFDEQGQAASYERKIEICSRAYKILTERVGFEPKDIIFDVNVLAVATGIEEHNRYAIDFIRAVEYIKQKMPDVKCSGGVSNLSFAFRGNNYLRESMHSVFLYHAIKAGLDMAIINPSTSVMYKDIPNALLELIEDVILCRRADAAERLADAAEEFRGVNVAVVEQADTDRRTQPLTQRIIEAVRRGADDYLELDLIEALAEYQSAAAIIEGPLMEGMSAVGEAFGEGKMFLPQVVKSARTMHRAVDILRPYMEKESESACCNRSNGRFLLATVKGDVHDIGKNIAGVVLSCNNFEVIDLGVMVSSEKIVEEAVARNVDFIGLSGLITPSLEEMCNTAVALRQAGVAVPLFIGGATTSPLHTAVKIAPLYDGVVVHVKDASQNPLLALSLSGSDSTAVKKDIVKQQELLRRQYVQQKNLSSEGSSLRFIVDWDSYQAVKPSYLGVRTLPSISIDRVRPYINWIHFYNLWRVDADSSVGCELQAKAEAMLDDLEARFAMVARVGLFEAYGTEQTIEVVTTAGEVCSIDVARQRFVNREGHRLSLCDFVAPQTKGDYIGVFAVAVSDAFADALAALKESSDIDNALLMQSLGDRLVEAASEYLHYAVRAELWGYDKDEKLSVKEMFAAQYRGIRPAVGYPSLPEQQTIFTLDKLLDFGEIGITLTENGAMLPQSSICGLYIAHSEARYFIVDNENSTR